MTTTTINPLTLMPKNYRPYIKQWYGSEFNTLVYKLSVPGESKKDGDRKEIAVPFIFKGYSLIRAQERIRKWGSKIVAEVQRRAWLLLPKDSSGNFLVEPDHENI